MVMILSEFAPRSHVQKYWVRLRNEALVRFELSIKEEPAVGVVQIIDVESTCREFGDRSSQTFHSP